jgi:hypothetical protein
MILISHRGNTLTSKGFVWVYPEKALGIPNVAANNQFQSLYPV